MGDHRLQLARLVALAASDLEAIGYPRHGIVRQAARALLEQPAPQPEPDPDRCRRCGAPLEQPPTGRPRVWCSDRCRRRKRAESDTSGGQ